jgi:hypothetical protein
MTLFQKYLNSVALFDTPNDQGSNNDNKETPVKPEIKVESVDNRKDKDPAIGDPDPDEDEENDDDENNPDPDAPADETVEQKTERVAKEKEDRRQARVQKRIDKLTASNAAAQNEITELKKQLAEKPKEGLTEEEVERHAQAIADAKLKDKEAKDAEGTFAKAADTLIKNSSKVDKDFEKKINEVAKETDTLMPKYMVEILSDLDNENGHEILASLANDADLYEEICVLPERKMTQRLIRMSDKLKEDKAKAAREAKLKNGNNNNERLPDPITPINEGVNNQGNTLPKNPTANMDDFVRIRQKQQEEFRKARGR